MSYYDAYQKQLDSLGKKDPSRDYDMPAEGPQSYAGSTGSRRKASERELQAALEMTRRMYTALAPEHVKDLLKKMREN